MKTGCGIILFLLLVLGPPATVQAEGPVSLVWAFFVKGDSDGVRSLSFDQPEGVTVGELLRIFLQLQEKTYVYLYLHDSFQDLYLVFPPSPYFYDEEFPAWRKFYIPSGRGWFVLDQAAGIERFYLLASNRRLFDLEGLTERFLLEPDSKELQARLLAAIRQQSTALAETASLEQNLVTVPYTDGQLALRELSTGSLANLTRANGDFSLVFDLVNR